MAFAYEGVPREHPPDMGKELRLVRKDPAVRAFRADMSWFGHPEASPSSAEAAERARKYWSGCASEAPQWEWLVDGPLKVIGPVPTRPLPRARIRKRMGGARD